MARCPQCGAHNRSGNKFCEDCGATLKFDRRTDDGTVVIIDSGDSADGSMDAPLYNPGKYGARGAYVGGGLNGSSSYLGSSAGVFFASLASMIFCYGFASPVTLVFSIINLNRAKKSGEPVPKLARVAVVLSAIGIAETVLATLFIFARTALRK